MQDLAIDLAYTTLLLFVFGTVGWVRRPDDRARCWFAGWLYLFGSYLFSFAQMQAAGWHKVAFSALSVNLMALAGISFVVSAVIRAHGRRFAIGLWLGIAIPTAVCLTLATIDLRSRWILAAAIVVRQSGAVAKTFTMRRIWPQFIAAVAMLCTANGLLMLSFALHGQTGLIVAAILAEIYLVAAIDVWNKRAENVFGTHLSAFGLLGWAGIFPLTEMAHRMWPEITAASDLWNPPKACVAVGMLLIVFEEEVRAARALGRDYRLVFDSNPNPLWILDVESLRFLAANGAASALHGYSKEEFLQLHLPDVLHPDVRANIIREAREPMAVSNRASRHRRKDGSDFSMDITSHSVIFQGKACRFVLGVDVTRRETLERKLEYQSHHDALTGLANRRSFEEQLSNAVGHAMKTGEKLALLCFDIYHFKRLNEVYGPRIGDECVQYVANVLSARARAVDFVARTGDDEFAIVLTELRDLSFAEEMTGYLIESFKAPISIGEYEVQLSFSLGVAVCPADGTDAMGLWYLAQAALRRAQAKGRGQIVWLSPELRADTEKTLEIAASMSRILEEGHFHLVYQPLYADDGAMRGMEALLRLNHPHYGPISPLSVIRTAEESGTIELLGQWVFERACRQIQTWMEAGMRLVPVAINVSTLQLMRRGFAERLAQTLERYGVNSQWIHLEITETAAMDNLKAVSGEMKVLSALGCRFSIDDFGTGYSSLGRLHQLPISILKIDRSFVVNLCHYDGNGGDTSETIVQAILSMAHALGLHVVAEGVETEQQLTCLRQLGCDFYQGFLLSRPVEPEKIPALINATHPAFRAHPKHAPSSSCSEMVVETRA